MPTISIWPPANMSPYPACIPSEMRFPIGFSFGNRAAARRRLMTATLGDVGVSSAEASPGDNRDPERLENMSADSVVGLGSIHARVRDFPLRQKLRLQMLSGKIRGFRTGNGADTGNRRNRLFHSLMERHVRSGGVAILRQDDLREEQVIGAESGIDGREAEK